MSPQQMMQIAVTHHEAGRLIEAENLYRQMLSQRPDANVHNNLGYLLFSLGKNDLAIVEIRRAIALRPDLAEPHNNLGVVLAGSRRFDEAIAEYRAAIGLDARHAQARNNLGNSLKAVGRAKEAMECYQTALTLDTNYAEAHSNLGALLNELGDAEAAIACHRRAIALRPEYAECHSNLGSALGNLGRHEEAINAQHRAIALRPDFAAAHVNLGLELLMRGDFPQGWAEYEWRYRVPGLSGIRKHFQQPAWDGANLGNRVLLVHAEQGFGDAIQFLRYVPMVPGRVLVDVHPPLKRLVKDFCTLAEDGAKFDVHLPLMSLPLALRQFDPTAGAQSSYLQANDGLRQQWRQRMGQRKGLRVGLTWAGSATHKNDRNRSIPLAKLSPLAQTGIEFFSLQVGRGSDLPATMPLTDLTEHFSDFAETAALITELDLVISVDTAVAHLAGAMGKTVWLLLPTPADFRWMLDRSDSPWYPTMRLFRQNRSGNWDEPIEQIAGELFKLL
jgi:tetratricopeptide (TPR) repeat protein